MLDHWVYEAYILKVKSTAPKLIFNIIHCESAGSDRWSCVGEQMTTAPPPFPQCCPSMTKVTLGADPAMMERASAQHVHLLIASIQIRQADRETHKFTCFWVSRHMVRYTVSLRSKTHAPVIYEYTVPSWEKRTNSLYLMSRSDKGTTGCPVIFVYDLQDRFSFFRQGPCFCNSVYHFHQ